MIFKNETKTFPSLVGGWLFYYSIIILYIDSLMVQLLLNNSTILFVAKLNGEMKVLTNLLKGFICISSMLKVPKTY